MGAASEQLYSLPFQLRAVRACWLCVFWRHTCSAPQVALIACLASIAPFPQILGQSQRNNVPFEAPTVMGGGVMEWRRDRDRHLHLHSGFVMDRSLPSAGMLSGLGPTAMGGSGRPASAIDLLNLAAALARQSFPPTYKITVLT